MRDMTYPEPDHTRLLTTAPSNVLAVWECQMHMRVVAGLGKYGRASEQCAFPFPPVTEHHSTSGSGSG